MTIIQAHTVYALLSMYTLDAPTFHHGGCVGADEEAHAIAVEFELPIWIHPANIPEMQARCEGGNKTICTTRPPLVRNRAIVAATELVIATPYENEEVLRSGTWATIRQAQRLGKHIIVVYPDGRVHEQNTRKPSRDGYVVEGAATGRVHADSWRNWP